MLYVILIEKYLDICSVNVLSHKHANRNTHDINLTAVSVSACEYVSDLCRCVTDHTLM